MSTHNMNVRSLSAPTAEDYAEFDNWTDGSFHISEWEFPVVPPGHWLHDVAPVADPDLKPILVKVRQMSEGEVVFFVVNNTADSYTESKEDAFAQARAHARIQYGVAVRKYKPNLIAAEARGEYERRREEDRISSMAKVVVDLFQRHPEILDSYRDTATTV